MAQFHVPILGISSDRTWIWLVNLALGPLFYYIIRDSFSNFSYLLSNLLEKLQDKKNWMMLLSTTQIISSSTQKLSEKRSIFGRKIPSSFVKLTVMCLIFSIPIFVSGLLLYDWIYFVSQKGDTNCLENNQSNNIDYPNFIIQFICHVGIKNTYSGFFQEPEFLGGMLTIPLLFCEIVLFTQICKLLKNLSGLHQKIRDS